MFPASKQRISNIVEPKVNNNETRRLKKLLYGKRFVIEKPRSAEKMLINTIKIRVFKKSKFTSFLFLSIKIFIMLEIVDIKK